MRFVDDLGYAFGWIAPEPPLLERASHAIALDGRVWVIDPVADDEALERVRALGEPAGVLQLLDRHNRDCRAVADRLGVPLHVVPGVVPPGAPFELVPVLDRRRWHEVALWLPEQRLLVCADAVGTAPQFVAPGERLAVNPLLRLTPPRVLLRYEPELLLTGHGAGILEDAAAAVRDAVVHARRRGPAWLAATVRRGLSR